MWIFELQSKTRSVLPLFRIRRKSFAVTCYITLIFEATSYRSKSSEKIVQYNISLTVDPLEKFLEQKHGILSSALVRDPGKGLDRPQINKSNCELLFGCTRESDADRTLSEMISLRDYVMSTFSSYRLSITICNIFLLL